MNLHETPKLYEEAVQFTAQQKKIRPVYIEKDYWVTYVLYHIFNNEIGKYTVFKGGTALSKCYSMIERFSEDIDLVVLRKEGESNNALTTKIKNIGKLVGGLLPEISIEGLTQKMGMNRKTAHTYKKVFHEDFGQIRDVIVLEATWLGYFEPFTNREVISFVGEMMLKTGQEKLARQYDMLPFTVQVLEPVRTICEKIMSLVRFSYGDDPIGDLKKKVRHVYDLNQLLKHEKLVRFIEGDDFSTMLLKVAQDDVSSFKNNNKWLAHHPNESLLFKDNVNVWKEIEGVYNTDFKGLVYGELPDSAEMQDTIYRIKNRLKKIDWNINLEG